MLRRSKSVLVSLVSCFFLAIVVVDLILAFNADAAEVPSDDGLR